MVDETLGTLKPYHKLLDDLPKYTLVTDKYYALPRTQPLILKPTEVAYCFDKNLCAIRAVKMYCIPLTSCRLEPSRVVKTAYEAGKKYTQMLNFLINVIQEEFVPKHPLFREKFIDELFELLGMTASTRSLSDAVEVYKKVKESYAGRRLMASIRRLLMVYLPKMPKLTKIEEFLAQNCPNTALARYHKLYTSLKNMEKILATAQALGLKMENQ